MSVTSASESLDKISAAVSAVQSQIKPAVKDSTNPFFKSKYADLNAVWESCRELLGKTGLSVIQTFEWCENATGLRTTLLHVSGQWISGVQRLNPVKDDPQGIGSAATYARRYGLAAIVGIVSEEDDDGNAASTPPARTVGDIFPKSAVSTPVNQINTPAQAKLAALAAIKKGVTGTIAQSMTIARMKTDPQWTEEDIAQIAAMTFPPKP